MMEKISLPDCAGRLEHLESERVRCCEAAVVRVFTELRMRGECERVALGAAFKVFAFHEPVLPPHLASEIVKRWTIDR